MTHETLLHNLVVRTTKVARVSYFVADSCNKSHNKNLNRDQLYWSQLVETTKVDCAILVYIWFRS